MPKYLAVITGIANEYSFGGSLPYEVKKEKRFDADSDARAKEMAEQFLRESLRGLLCPRNFKISSLEQINPGL